MADSGCRFGGLFDFVRDPVTPIVAFDRVAGNRGADTPGIDGLSATAPVPEPVLEADFKPVSPAFTFSTRPSGHPAVREAAAAHRAGPIRALVGLVDCLDT